MEKLRGSLLIEYTLAKHGAKKLRQLFLSGTPVRTLGAYNGQQAIQYAKGGLNAIYVSGWQVAAANNTSLAVYPDQSLYPVDSVPRVVREINSALRRADQIQTLHGGSSALDYYLPIIADAEAGFGGPLNAYELMRNLVEAGAAAVHFEDQLASEKKCGHLGGKVLIPIQQMILLLRAARLAAEVTGVDTVLIARTDAESATFLTSDVDPLDAPFITAHQRSPEGFFKFRCGIDACIVRALAYAPYVDMLWFETSKPDIGLAKQFAEAIHAQFPGKWLAYNCSPSFRWRNHLSEKECEEFQQELFQVGYVFQFVTLAGFHATNLATFELAKSYQERGMGAYSHLQEKEWEAQDRGYTAVRHQNEVGVSYFDAILATLGIESTAAMNHSTEAKDF
jgi:isocitrate lyase